MLRKTNFQSKFQMNATFDGSEFVLNIFFFFFLNTFVGKATFFYIISVSKKVNHPNFQYNITLKC